MKPIKYRLVLGVLMVAKHGLLVLLVTCVVAAHADDWPTFMHDNQRTGVTAESLRPPLRLN
jgi:hypothetical protein